MNYVDHSSEFADDSLLKIYAAFPHKFGKLTLTHYKNKNILKIPKQGIRYYVENMKHIK